MYEFQNAAFVPFEHYVNRARRSQRRAAPAFGSRRIDFTDAVIVTVTPIDEVPEFADTVPDFAPDFEPTYPMELPAVTYVPVDIAVTDDVVGAAEVIAAKLERAKNFVSSRAFTECLHAGYFPPRCQACSR